MNDEFANNLATTIFLGSLVPAWFAWRMTRSLGTALPPFNRAMQRLAFSLAVFLGCFGCLAFVAWLFGSIFNTKLFLHTNVAFISLVSIGLLLWAALSYKLLKWRTLREDEHRERPS